MTYKKIDINGIELTVGQLCLVSTSADLRIAYLSELTADPPADLKEPHLRRWTIDPPTRFTYIKPYGDKTSALITWTEQHVLVLDSHFAGAPYHDGRYQQNCGPIVENTGFPERTDIIGTPLRLRQVVAYKSSFFNNHGHVTNSGGLVLGVIVEFGPRGGIKISRILSGGGFLGAPGHVSKFLVVDEPRLLDRIIKFRLTS